MKYHIREGSLLWALKSFWFVILGAIILVWLAFPTTPEVYEALHPEEAQAIQEEPAEPDNLAPLYDVPLSAELQLHIRDLCGRYNVDMPLVLAVIGQESNYKAGAVGDGGSSIGLMQIQPQHHQARMDRLGVMDLSDPYQNVDVGIDLLAELMGENKGTEWAVTAYNAGAAAADHNRAIGVRSEYADCVLTLMEMLRKEKNDDCI